MFWSTLLMSFREIRRNTLRSILTTLGVIIGVAAVIAMVTLGQGATARITSDIASLGKNLLFVFPGSARRTTTVTSAPPLRVDDARAVLEEVAGVANVAAAAGRSALVVYGNKNWRTGITGTTNNYFEVREWGIATGRRFTDSELLTGAPVCILGATPRRELFGNQDPLGAQVRAGNVSFEVIGVLTEKGRSTFGDDQDDFVAIPLATFHRRVAGNTDVGVMYVSASESTETSNVQRGVEALMRQRRGIPEDGEGDVIVRDTKEISDLASKATGVLTALLGAIASVSLLVGGIGIMNIMLVSVTERTREIGLRLAIGARASEVLLQFLVEATVLSTLGGVLGIALGLGGSYLAAHALKLPFVFIPQIVVVAFVFSGMVGIAFGYFPARKAAKLNPIDALRYE
ncbi:MAG: ABC transporter permease [Sandaracinaceae bacterium]|nr:ABC transporter permease [Sandaracinaceae bacterium]